jgi:hypothetical protein
MVQSSRVHFISRATLARLEPEKTLPLGKSLCRVPRKMTEDVEMCDILTPALLKSNKLFPAKIARQMEFNTLHSLFPGRYAIPSVERSALETSLAALTPVSETHIAQTQVSFANGDEIRETSFGWEDISNLTNVIGHLRDCADQRDRDIGPAMRSITFIPGLRTGIQAGLTLTREQRIVGEEQFPYQYDPALALTFNLLYENGKMNIAEVPLPKSLYMDFDHLF